MSLEAGEEILEKRRELGMLEVALQLSRSEDSSRPHLRPSKESIQVDPDLVDQMNEILDNSTASDIERRKNRKEGELSQLFEDVDVEEDELEYSSRRNVDISRNEIERGSGVIPQVADIVEGDNGLKQSWGQAETFDEVKDDFIQMIEEYREFSGGNYDEVLALWEPNIDSTEIEEIVEGVKQGAMPILEDLDIEDVRNHWEQNVDWLETDTELHEVFENTLASQELLAHYIFGGNPVKMPVRIGSSGMEYGNSIMAPLETVEDRFWLKCFDTTAHEFGHTYLRQELSEENTFLPLGEPPSEAVDEGVARLYQNFVFRSKPFQKHFSKTVTQDVGLDERDPEEYGEAFFNWFNAINPENTERISADPITYPLHVAIRYELEKELIESDEPAEDIVDDLGNMWNEKFREYIAEPLGAEIEDMPDSETVLQDVHWGKGKMGYFPNYLVGDVLASGWRNAISEQEDDGLDSKLQEGNVSPVNDFIAEEISQYGKDFLQKSDYWEIDPENYVQFMQELSQEIYGQK